MAKSKAFSKPAPKKGKKFDKKPKFDKEQKDKKPADKVTKKRLPAKKTEMTMKYNVDTNTYKKIVKRPQKPQPSKKTDKKTDNRGKQDEDAPKEKSKSAKFWELQSKKAQEKRDGKKAKDEEFETVPAGPSSGWESGSEIDSMDESESEGEMEQVVTPGAQDQADNESGVSESEEEYDEKAETEKKVKAANRKGKKSGGFQSMGLSFPIFKAIQHQGYKIPTPIQRKAIPVIMEGGDVVSMARTGSGKTAAFLIPLIERLKQHSAKVGARGLVLSPSRELATQTLKFAKDFAKYTDLRICAFVGGDNMDDQFSALASNPDIIIATPGRLMHLIIEASLQMASTEYLVFDEADRLFEMGFAEQLREIMARMPLNRQTLLFSATLPKILVDFARAGLVNPTLIRLDVDTKISRDLQKMYFFQTKKEDKNGALLYLLGHFIPSDQQTVVFVSTKHHVEFIHELLISNGFSSTYIYGSLDQTARKIHLARFKHNKVKILVVTDVAARGIDVPLLDNVINYDFPSSSKVFVHRVGRTARAGKSGCAWSMVSQDEVPFMLDLQLFTGRPLIFASAFNNSDSKPDYTTELIFGKLPATQVALEVESVARHIKGNVALETMKESAKNGYQMYIRSRPVATRGSYTRAKEIAAHEIGANISDNELKSFDMIASISSFRPAESVFEVGKKGGKTAEAILMQKRRKQFADTIATKKLSVAELHVKEKQSQQTAIRHRQANMEVLEEEDLDGFVTLGNGKASKQGIVIDLCIEKETKDAKDSEYYLSYRPADDNTEMGYAVHAGEGAGFNALAHKASLDIVADEEGEMKKQNQLRWDSKKHRFTKDQIGSDNKKRIRTENGTLVAATFKSDRFDRWQKRTKIDLPRAGEAELTGHGESGASVGHKFRHNNVTAPQLNSKSFARKQASKEKELRKSGLKGKDLDAAKKDWVQSRKSQGGVEPGKAAKSELKSAMEIAKERHELDLRREKTGRHAHIVGGGRGGRGGSRGGSRGGRGGRGGGRGGGKRGGRK